MRFEQVHDPSSEKGQIWKFPNNLYINVMQWKLSVPNKSHVICKEVLRFMIWGSSESCLNYRNLSPVILENLCKNYHLCNWWAVWWYCPEDSFIHESIIHWSTDSTFQMVSIIGIALAKIMSFQEYFSDSHWWKLDQYLWV